MKLSKDTVALLKNFSTINSNLVVKQGNVLSTISAAKSVYAHATVPEMFPSQFGIYDLNQFIQVLSLFEDPNIEFEEKFLTVSQAGRKIKYFSAETDVLTYPLKEIKSPPTDIEFDLTAVALGDIMKTVGILSANDVSFIGNGSTITVTVGDRKNLTSNSFQFEVGKTTETFAAHLKGENFKFVPGDYKVELSTKRAAKFSAGDVFYVVAMEADSVFN
jgi:hypothetical protein